MSLPFWAWQKSPPLRVFRQSYAEESLEQLFGRKIDLPTVSALKNPYFIDAVNQSRQSVYASARAQAA